MTRSYLSFFGASLVLAAVGCAGEAALPPQDGPPLIDNADLLAGGKADSSLALGTFTVVGTRAVYHGRGSDEPLAPQGSEAVYDSDSDLWFTCFSDGTNDVFFDYQNDSLPWGVKLTLVRGARGRGWCGGCDPAVDAEFSWSQTQETEMHATGPWTWSAHSVLSGYQGAQGGELNGVQFVVRIDFPDGSVRWDNGGAAWGYYDAPLPSLECDLDQPAHAEHSTKEQLLPVGITYP